MLSENIVNACWSSDGQNIGQPFRVFCNTNTTGDEWSKNGFASPNSQPWFEPYVPYVPYVESVPVSPSCPPYTPPFTYPSPYPSQPTPTEDRDAQGNRVVKSPSPSLELILVEIAKVLKEGGDILQVREIFERHKLKLVDHDGEIIFDPHDIEKLEGKGF